MRQRVAPGGYLEIATPAEVAALIPRGREATHIRAAESITLDAAGAGQDEVYKVPTGYGFFLRRVSLLLSSATDPATGNVALNVAGQYIAYLRSGTLIEFAIPVAATAQAQVPGVQTWAFEEGPYLRNGEVFEIKAAGLTAGAQLIVQIQGILQRPAVSESA